MGTRTVTSEAAPCLKNAYMSSEENIGGKKTPEDSSGHIMPIRLPEEITIQQVLEVSADAEFGLMPMPEWVREPAALRSTGLFSQLSGVGRRIWPRGENE